MYSNVPILATFFKQNFQHTLNDLLSIHENSQRKKKNTRKRKKKNKENKKEKDQNNNLNVFICFIFIYPQIWVILFFLLKVTCKKFFQCIQTFQF